MYFRIGLLFTLAINFLHASSVSTPLSPHLFTGFPRSSLENRIEIDIETTGTRRYLQMSEDGTLKHPDKIVEIYLRKFQNNQLIGTFYSLFNPGDEKLSTYAARVHKLSTEELRKAPSFTEKAAEIEDFINGFVLVGHNCAFDAGFLHDEFLRAGLNIPFIPYKCTRWMLYRDYRREISNQPVYSPSPKQSKRRLPLDEITNSRVKRKLDFTTEEPKSRKMRKKYAKKPKKPSFSLDACLERKKIKLDSESFHKECENSGVPKTRRHRHAAPYDVYQTGALLEIMIT